MYVRYVRVCEREKDALKKYQDFVFINFSENFSIIQGPMDISRYNTIVLDKNKG